MQIARIKSLSSYNNYRNKNAGLLEAIWAKEKHISETKKNSSFTIKGFSYPAENMVDFQVDYLYSDNDEINWRERLVCPITGLNNRLRACIHFVDFELGLRPYNDIYVSEQATPLYTFLKKKFPRLTGSEFLGKDKPPGFINGKNLRHEQATNLSFEDQSMDGYLSFDRFEHVPDFTKAFSEAARILKPSGKFMWSVSFANMEYENIIRSFIDDNGNVQHILEPEYRYDPVSENNMLCFTQFGWEMLDQVKNAGFTNVYAFLYRSEVFGYLGGEQILFIADKSPQ